MNSNQKTFTLYSFIFIIYILCIVFSLYKLNQYFIGESIFYPLIITIILLITFIIIIFLQEKINNKITYILYNLSNLITGFFYILTIIILLIEIFRLLNIIKINLYIYGIISIVLTIIIFTYSVKNTNKYKIKEINLKTNKINKNTQIVQLSDLHIFGKYSKTKFENIFKKVIKINPDYIVITGDLFDFPGKIYKEVLDITKKFKKPIFFIYGNHDILYGIDNTNKILKETNITCLDTNSYLDLKRNINFIGVGYNRKKNHLLNSLNKIKINTKNYNLLLYHEPKDIKVAERKGIDLLLSGHTHGGQIFPLTLLIVYLYKYYKGLHSYKKLKIYINQGTCIFGYRLRLKTFNEITLINLIKK
jgi:uncharacterized protein